MRRGVVIGQSFDLEATVLALAEDSELEKENEPKVTIVVGREWDLQANKWPGNAETIEARTRSFLVKFVAVMGALFLLGGAAFGTLRQDYGILLSIWSVVGPIYSGMAGYYFASRAPK